MTTSPNLDPEEIKQGDPESLDQPGQPEEPGELSADPEYLELLERYQNAEFEMCHIILNKLEQRYPEHPELQKIRDDLELKSSAKSLESTIKNQEKRNKRKRIRNLVIFAAAALLIVIVTFIVTFSSLQRQLPPQQQVDTAATQVISLYEQADQLLDVGKPELAMEIIEQIKAIDPQFENLSQLSSRAEDLLALEVKYQAALDLVAEGQEIDALVLFQEIQAEKPGMWDVEQQITSLSSQQQIEDLLSDGNEAFQAENWNQAITAYEKVYEIDPKIDDPVMKEQLLQAYLNEIIAMLQDENASFEDIEKAEGYYRKAIALIPQDKEFTEEKLRLQEASSNLLLLQLTQTAKTILEESTQTVSSIEQAASLYRKAANIDPNNAALQQNLQNTESYKIGFQSFIDLEWESAIASLEQIITTDLNFANGKAYALLYEAYYYLGKQYDSAGLYIDAIRNYEQAEIMAWEDTDNQLKLFQVQIAIGNALGKIEDYENAVSYYEYALNAIQFAERLEDQPVISERFTEATALLAEANYEDAYLAFQDVLSDIDFIYTISEVRIGDGVCLAIFASENQSTLDAVIDANDLTNTMVIRYGRTLQVPSIQ